MGKTTNAEILAGRFLGEMAADGRPIRAGEIPPYESAEDRYRRRKEKDRIREYLRSFCSEVKGKFYHIHI